MGAVSVDVRTKFFIDLENVNFSRFYRLFDYLLDMNP
jgi:hypothetical protein